MGLFNSYLKPGPGVEKDAPKKKGLFLYLELFFRKFFKLIQANMLFFLISLPLIAIVYIFAPVNILLSAAQSSAMEITEEQMFALSHTLRAMISIVVLTFFGSGPASAGLAYILRCVTREEHAWIMSDFFQKFKENFKQSIIVIIVDLIFLPLMINAAYYYFQMYLNAGNTMFLILLYLVLVATVMFMLMHIYIYQLMVTYECKLKALYKNAFLFAMAKLPLNIILSIISLVLIYIVFSYLEATFALLLFFLLIYNIVRFPLEFYAARTIQKLIAATPKEEIEE